MNSDVFAGKYALVVEDEECLANILRQELERVGFEKVLVAYDGAECIPLLQKYGENIHVMTLNLMMPKMTGFDVMEYLVRSHKHILAVIMITGNDELWKAQKFISYGTETILAFDYITKPFDSECVIRSVREAVTQVEKKRNPSHHNIPEARYAKKAI